MRAGGLPSQSGAPPKVRSAANIAARGTSSRPLGATSFPSVSARGWAIGLHGVEAGRRPRRLPRPAQPLDRSHPKVIHQPELIPASGPPHHQRLQHHCSLGGGDRPAFRSGASRGPGGRADRRHVPGHRRCPPWPDRHRNGVAIPSGRARGPREHAPPGLPGRAPENRSREGGGFVTLLPLL